MDIYFDNAATSWPKPRSVIDAMNRFNEFTGSNPGRSGHHRSVEAGRVIFKTRDALAELFGISDPLRIVLTYNITHSLNIVLQGILQRGDHVITTSMEHNSVMRPLRDLETKGVEVTVINCDHHGALDSSKIPECIKKSTKLIVTTHASNVTGTVFPIKEIGKIASEHGIPYCVDAAQTAGVLEIDVKEFNIDLLCFTGHKSLYGPMGTGGLYIRKGLEEKIRPLTFGGTGSRSEFEVQPDFMPDKYESGTLNAIGIAGLYEGLMFIKDTGIKKIHEKENLLIKRFISGVSGINEIHLYGPDSDAERVAVCSFNIEGFSSSDTALILDEKYGILTRPGLHCAPSAHHTIGTFPGGTNRISIGYFNTEDEVDRLIRALHEISKKNNITGRNINEA